MRDAHNFPEFNGFWLAVHYQYALAALLSIALWWLGNAAFQLCRVCQVDPLQSLVQII